MSKEAIMAAESAIKSAATLFQGTGDTEGAATAAQRFYQGIISLSGVDPSQVEAQAQANAMANAQQNLANAGVQSTVARDLSNEEARWKDALVDNPNDWYNNVGDNRATSGGGNGPDFKFKDQNADVKALFLNGKYGPAPAWVFEKLGLPFPGSGQAPAQQAPQPAAPAAPAQQAPVPF